MPVTNPQIQVPISKGIPIMRKSKGMLTATKITWATPSLVLPAIKLPNPGKKIFNKSAAIAIC